jgi:hypothetical protein
MFLGDEYRLEPWKMPVDLESLLTDNENSKILGRSKPTLQKDRLRGSGPPQFGKVLARCRQLNHFARMAGRVSEPEWKGCLGVLTFAENGRELAHSYSAGDPRYNPEETDRKFDARQKLSGPTTCAYFQKLDPAPCDACTWRSASLVTPLNVGRLT